MDNLERLYEALIAGIEEMLNTTTSVMAPYPIDVVGRVTPFTKRTKARGNGRGEKRAPHTEVKITEEYKKESMGKQSNAMMKYKYKKLRSNNFTNIEETMINIAALCNAILKN